MKIKSPKLREQALTKINTEEQQSSVDGARCRQPVEAENNKALNEIVKQVATKLGVQGRRSRTR